MTNRFRQGLYNKIDKKKTEIEEKEELSHADLLREEELDNIRDELDQSVLSEEKFELFEARIESV